MTGIVAIFLWIVVICILAGLAYYVIDNLVTVPQPINKVAKVVIVVVAVLAILYLLVGNVGFPSGGLIQGG